jgi:hypothetical protein
MKVLLWIASGTPRPPQHNDNCIPATCC